MSASGASSLPPRLVISLNANWYKKRGKGKAEKEWVKGERYTPHPYIIEGEQPGYFMNNLAKYIVIV